MQTVVETPGYLKAAESIFSVEERADIVAMAAARPECGEVIRGTGGFRKVRVARAGMGKARRGASDLYRSRRSIPDLLYYGLRQERERKPDVGATQPIGQACR